MKIMDIIVDEINNSLPEGEKVERLHSKPYEIKETRKPSREIKWTQWGSKELFRCGKAEYKTIMEWMRSLGADAKKCVSRNEKDHALYGRTVHDENGRLTEIRFYCNVYLTDEELDEISRKFPHDTLYVAHK